MAAERYVISPNALELAGAELSSPRAQALADELRMTSEALIAIVLAIDVEHWSLVRKPDEWSPGKDAEHAVDAAAMHLWHVCLALGMPQPDPPVIERARLTAVRSPVELAVLLRNCVESGAQLIDSLTDAQLELPAKPLRRPPRTVADIIARPLIRHLAIHREAIESKLRAARRSGR